MRVAVIGVGHMGSWFTRELSKKNRVAIHDTNKQKMDQFENVSCLNDLSELKPFEPEILLNAVSLQNTVEVFEESTRYISKDCVIVDIASIKGEIPDYYKKCPFGT